MPLAARDGDRVVLPLALAMLKAYRPGEAMWLDLADHGVTSVRQGTRSIPVAEDGQLLLNYRGKGRTIEHISALALLNGSVSPEVLAGRLVVVGVSAVAVSDLRVTPFEGSFPGVEIHATVLDNVLTGDFLTQPDWMVLVELGAILFAAVLLGFFLDRARGGWGALVASALAAAYVFGSQQLFVAAGVPLGLVYPLLAIGLVYTAVTALHYVAEESAKRQIRSAFSSYLAPSVVDIVASDPSKLRLGGESKDLTILFSDIRGFTTISEALTPEGLTTLLNRYLTPMTHAVLDTGGTIDKYIGDAIMAFWNAPLDDPAHHRNACGAALCLYRLLEPLNETFAREAEEQGTRHIPIRIGVGVNSGPCVVGNMGSDVRFDYSVLGDAVNLASRLEGQTKTYGVAILISESTLERAGGFATLEVDLVRVKGKQQPVRIHVLLGEPELVGDARFTRLAELHLGALEAYRARRWDEAERLVAEARALDVSVFALDRQVGLSVLYDEYSRRIAAYRIEPPAPDWDGVFTATSK